VPAPFAPHALATVHPSFVLRQTDDEARHRELAAFVADLTAGRRILEASGEAARE